MADPADFDLTGLDPVARELVELVLRVVGGDLSARGSVSSSGGGIDALTIALNMLAESFQREHEARARAETLLADAIDAYELAPDAFCSCELESLRIVKCNPALSQALGEPQSALLGRSLLDLVHESGRPALLQMVENLLVGGSVQGVDVELTGVHGPVISAVTGAIKHDAHGKPLRLLLSLRDETKNRRLAEELVQAQRLDALARLAGGVAHDFNNLLLVISTSAELVSDKLGEHPDVREELRIIRDASERAAILTRDLLAFARKESTPPALVILDEAVVSAEPLLRRLLGPNVRLSFKLAAPDAGALVASGQIGQLLTNLVVNARDVMPGGGEIEVSTRRRHIDPNESAEQPEVLPGDYVELSVRDEGPGISPEVRPRIFEPFFTTKPTGRGTGLGLSIVHGIMRQAHGFVQVDSTAETGTTFSLLFPLHGQAPRPEVEHPSMPKTAPTLLVIEDDRLVRTLTSRVLRGAGYEVIEASGGGEAMAVMSQQGPRLSLIVSDVVMPGSDGVEVLGALRRSRPDIPCLFVTGYAREEGRIRALSNVSLLYKPFVPSSLLSAVSFLLADRPANAPSVR